MTLRSQVLVVGAILGADGRKPILRSASAAACASASPRSSSESPPWRFQLWRTSITRRNDDQSSRLGLGNRAALISARPLYSRSIEVVGVEGRYYKKPGRQTSARTRLSARRSCSPSLPPVLHRRCSTAAAMGQRRKVPLEALRELTDKTAVRMCIALGVDLVRWRELDSGIVKHRNVGCAQSIELPVHRLGIRLRALHGDGEPSPALLEAMRRFDQDRRSERRADRIRLQRPAELQPIDE